MGHGSKRVLMRAITWQEAVKKIGHGKYGACASHSPGHMLARSSTGTCCFKCNNNESCYITLLMRAALRGQQVAIDARRLMSSEALMQAIAQHPAMQATSGMVAHINGISTQFRLQQQVANQAARQAALNVVVPLTCCVHKVDVQKTAVQTQMSGQMLKVQDDWHGAAVSCTALIISMTRGAERCLTTTGNNLLKTTAVKVSCKTQKLQKYVL